MRPTVSVPRRWRRLGGVVLAPATLAVLTGLLATTGGEPSGAAGLLADDPGLRPAVAVARALWLAGALTAGGMGLARAALRRHALPHGLLARATGAGLVVAAAGAVATVPLRAAVAAGSWAAMADLATIERQLAGWLGAALILGAAGLVAVAATTRRATPAALAVGALGGAVAATAPLLAGHAVTIDPRWLGMAAMGAHLLAAAAWIGGLATLAAVWWAARDDERLAGERGGVAAGVSALALAAVTLVALAGTALAAVQVERVAALSTPYGIALLAKLGVVAAVVTLAARNRARVRRGATGSGRFGRGVAGELAGIATILVASATLSALEPAGQAAAEPVSVEASAAGRDVIVVVDPAVAGANELHVYILDDGSPDGGATDTEVTATGPDGAEVTATTFTAGPGHWIDPGWRLATSGTWRVTVTFTAEGTEAEADVTVPIRD